MVLVAFNKKFINKDTNKIVEANEPIEMTKKRADEVVNTIKGSREDYEDFGYERAEVTQNMEENTDKESDTE